MQYGLMVYAPPKEHFNVGDYIQSLAARQFLPSVDCYINREGLDEYAGPPTKMIMNGWYMHQPRHWPPSSSIIPLFISVHLTPKARDVILGEKAIAYLKNYEVGARDHASLNYLHNHGVNAYFSGCLTLTLGKSYQHQSGTEVYFVDVLHKPQFWGRRQRILRRIFGTDLVKSAVYLTQRYRVRDYPTEEMRFRLAESLLTRYQHAKLVVTSRLHCALPCLAMGTPVIYVDVGVSKERLRFKGLEEILNTVAISGGRIKANFDFNNIQNKSLHLEYVQALSRRCTEFIQS